MSLIRKEKARRLPAHILRKVAALPRHKHHPLQHKVRSYGISRRTFYYMKEYGPRVNIVHEIVKDSLKVLIPAAVLSSVGGIAFQSVEAKIALFLPLLMLMPAISHMTGSLGTIMASRFTTSLYLGKVRGHPLMSPDVHKLFHVVMSIAFAASLYIGVLVSAVSLYRGTAVSLAAAAKILGASIVLSAVLTGAVFLVVIVLGRWIFRKKEDPNNFLIPIVTSIADFGALLMLSLMVAAYF